MEKLFAMFPEHEFKFSWWDTSNSFGQQMVVRGKGKIVECEKIKRRTEQRTYRIEA
jgi:hypothetical protein